MTYELNQRKEIMDRFDLQKEQLDRIEAQQIVIERMLIMIVGQADKCPFCGYGTLLSILDSREEMIATGKIKCINCDNHFDNDHILKRTRRKG